MGLDMYAFAIDSNLISEPVDFSEIVKKSYTVDIAYWRKHPNLHGWMEALYYSKGGSKDKFNCTPVLLTLDDLAALEKDVINNDLPSTTGFFFGMSDGSEKDDDLAFIERARSEIANGKAVFYDSWW